MNVHKPTDDQVRAVLLSILLVLSLGVAWSGTAGAAGQAEAGPSEVGVTTGAAGQSPFDSGSPTTLDFTENDSSAFPNGSGVATLTLPDSSDIRFNSSSDPTASVSGTGTNASIQRNDGDTIEINVSGVSDDQLEELSLEGVTFDVPSHAENTTLTWEFGTATGETDLLAEYLALDVQEDVSLARGVDEQPSNGIEVTITPGDKHSGGFHEEGERIVVSIPEAHRDAVSFNTDNAPEISSRQSSCDADLMEDYNATLQNYEFAFDSKCTLHPGRAYTVKGLYFDSPGSDINQAAEEEVTLEMGYAPVDRKDRVNTSGDDTLDVVAPDVGVGGNVSTLQAGDTSTSGDEPIRVTITDPHGGLVTDGSTINISFEDTGHVGFDEGQNLIVDQSNTTQQFDAEVGSITRDTIVLDVTGESKAKESITLVSESGDGILFDVLDNTENRTNLTVKTNARQNGSLIDSTGEDVVQVTEGGVRVDTGVTPSISLAGDAPTAVDRGANSSGGNQSVALEVTDEDGGAVAAGSTIDVNISDGSGVEFDTGQDLEVVAGSSGNEFNASVENVSAHSVTISVHENSTTDDSIRIQSNKGGLLFNVSDQPDAREVVFNVTTVNDVGVKTRNTTDTAVTVVEPTTDVALENGGPTTIEAGTNQSAGDTPIVVNVSDEVGGAVDEGTTIEVAFADQTEVAFDVSQTLAVERPEELQSFDATVEFVSADRVLLNVTGESAAGESIRLVGSGNESGIRFNVSEDAGGSVAFDVTTNNGERNVTLGTGPAVEVAGNGSDDSDSGGSDDSGGNNAGGDGAGGGGGGGAAPAPSANITVTNVSLSKSEIRQGGTVDVSVTLENDGNADGSYEVLVRANSLKAASETVDVAQGEEKTVTVPVRFAHAGDRKITVDGVVGGTVTIAELEPQDLPNGTVAADAQPVVDMDAGSNGTLVRFEENVTVDAIVFGNASNGTVTVADLEALPAEVAETPSSLIRAMDIEVPAELADEPATIRLSVDAEAVEDADAIRLGRYHDGEWQTFEPMATAESGGELVYEFETPGFSTFAVFAQETEDPQVTDTPEDTVEPTATRTATETDSGTDTDDDTEEAGLGAFGLVAIAVIALIAVLLAAAGARLHQQNKL